MRTAICLCILLIMSGCTRDPKGVYEGTVVNDSYGQEASLNIFFDKNTSWGLTGTVTIGPPLHGGGRLNAKRDGKNIRFTTSDSFLGRIVWMGEIEGKMISGTYVVEGLLSEKQGGRWVVIKR